jgi:hypothetical protein
MSWKNRGLDFSLLYLQFHAQVFSLMWKILSEINFLSSMKISFSLTNLSQKIFYFYTCTSFSYVSCFMLLRFLFFCLHVNIPHFLSNPTIRMNFTFLITRTSPHKTSHVTLKHYSTTHPRTIPSLFLSYYLFHYMISQQTFLSFLFFC